MIYHEKVLAVGLMGSWWSLQKVRYNWRWEPYVLHVLMSSTKPRVMASACRNLSIVHGCQDDDGREFIVVLTPVLYVGVGIERYGELGHRS